MNQSKIPNFNIEIPIQIPTIYQKSLFKTLLFRPRIPVQRLRNTMHPVLTPAPLRQDIGKRVP